MMQAGIQGGMLPKTLVAVAGGGVSQQQGVPMMDRGMPMKRYSQCAENRKTPRGGRQTEG